MSKPITITGVPGGYTVFVEGTPIVRSGTGLDFDRSKAGLKTKKGYKPPTTDVPVVFQQAGDAAHVAHKVGNYVLKLGDLVFSYTDLIDIDMDRDDWWEKALKE